jgi:hypothetical protein
MRNLLALAAALLLAFGLTCYYRGWCSAEPLPSDIGKSAFRVEIDRLKIARDVMDAARAIQRALNTEQAGKSEERPQDKTPPQ